MWIGGWISVIARKTEYEMFKSSNFDVQTAKDWYRR